MVNNSIHASENPDLVNSLVKGIIDEETQVAPADILFPNDTEVTLPGGYITLAGEAIKVAEVKELTGKDEEVISKAVNAGRIFTTILSRGVVKIGNQIADEALLDKLFIGDREALLLGIYKATFGVTASIPSYCSGCDEYKTVELNLDEEIPVKKIDDIVSFSEFLVKGTKNEYVVSLPNGAAQKEVIDASEKTGAELNTILLYSTIRKINGKPVISKNQIENLGLADRRTILAELQSKSFGPLFENQVVSCPDCTGEVVVPISLGTLFRL
jgi:hypothetical protein